jgi:HK97 family phage major capsid protein
MGYNSLIGSGDTIARTDIATEILKSVPAESAVLMYARRLQDMSSNQKELPVSTALATAYFTTGSPGLMQTSESNWTKKYIVAEELNVIVPVPKNVIEDNSFDIWAEVRPQVIEGFGKKIDAAILHGTDIPTSWTTNLGAAGLVAVSTAASQTVSLAAYTDIYEAMLGETGAGVKGVVSLLEEDGYMPTGHIAHTSIAGKLRNCRDMDGNPIFKSEVSGSMTFDTGRLDGRPITYPLNGAFDSSSALLIAGQWNQLVYAIRKDITFELSTDGVIQDGTGAIVYNLFQQNMVALKATMRIGFALPNPVNRINTNSATRCPFAVLTA